MPNLRIRQGGTEALHQIESNVVTIGRAPSNTVVIHDEKASKEHCRIERAGDRWKLIDLESKNGTRVNGEYTNKAWLDHGDAVQIGKVEIRFGVEAATRRARKTIAAPVPASRRQEEYEEGDVERPPPQRRYGRSASDKMLVIGISIVLTVGVAVVLFKVGGSMARDTYNLDLIDTAEAMMRRDQWDEAIEYLQRKVDSDGNAYEEVLERIQELQAQRNAFYGNRANQIAAKVLSRLARRIKAYHAGKQGATPEGILQLVERLKTEFAATESGKTARSRWPAWFAGRVPQRAAELMTAVGQLERDWDEARKTARQYEKEWRFREARETIIRFLTSREAVLDAAEVQRFRTLRDEQLARIDNLAESIYRGRERESWRLIKNKKYARAEKLFREIIEKFGIDLYMRKAQAEIRKIEELKAKG